MQAERPGPESSGMRGWFDQYNRILGSVTISGVKCEVQMLQLWDSHPHRRFGYIVDAAPRRARTLLNTYFSMLNPTKFMLSETRFMNGCLSTGPTHRSDTKPIIVLGDLWTMCAISGGLYPHIISNTHEIGTTGTAVDWCECRVMTHPTLALLLEGIVFQPPDTPHPLPDFDIWDRWLDAVSPNFPSVLQSMILALADKGLTCAFQDPIGK